MPAKEKGCFLEVLKTRNAVGETRFVMIFNATVAKALVKGNDEALNVLKEAINDARNGQTTIFDIVLPEELEEPEEVKATVEPAETIPESDSEVKLSDFNVEVEGSDVIPAT